MSEVVVDTEAVHGLGNDLQNVSEEVQSTADAGKAAGEMSDRAFGVLCAFMVPPTHVVSQAGTKALGVMAQAARVTATSTTAAAADYEKADSTSAEAFAALGQELA